MLPEIATDFKSCIDFEDMNDPGKRKEAHKGTAPSILSDFPCFRVSVFPWQSNINPNCFFPAKLVYLFLYGNHSHTNPALN